LETLKRIRTIRGLNQVDLAKASGVSQNTISEIETGRREARPATLRKLANALDIEIADFFEEADRPKAPAPASLEPSLFNGLEEERRWLHVGHWIATLDQQAELVEQVIRRGNYDLETIRNIEGAAVDLYGTYRATIRKEVWEWCTTPAQREGLQQAEDRMKVARAAAREAYEARREQARLEENQDPAELIALDERRREQVARFAEQEHADTGT
jgi:transcriptional regulator with XRE-family HTH domain